MKTQTFKKVFWILVFFIISCIYIKFTINTAIWAYKQVSGTPERVYTLLGVCIIMGYLYGQMPIGRVVYKLINRRYFK